jgi:hypothetical protein
VTSIVAPVVFGGVVDVALVRCEGGARSVDVTSVGGVDAKGEGPFAVEHTGALPREESTIRVEREERSVAIEDCTPSSERARGLASKARQMKRLLIWMTIELAVKIRCSSGQTQLP